MTATFSPLSGDYKYGESDELRTENHYQKFKPYHTRDLAEGSMTGGDGIMASLYKIGFCANLQEFNIPSYSIGQN